MLKSICTLLVCSQIFPSAASAEENETTSLFDGKDLSHWTVQIGKKSFSPDEQDIFKVIDGVIHVYPTQEAGTKQPFAGIVSKKSYESYHLSVEYKWGEKKFAPRAGAVRDAGVLVHCYDPTTIWPASVELQIQEGDTGDLWIIGTQSSSKIGHVTKGYDPKGKVEARPSNLKHRYSKVARSYCWEKPGWNKVELIVNGDKGVFKVNGHTVNEFLDAKKIEKDGTTSPLTKGHLLLQAEGAEIFYRNITIKPLPKS